MKNSEQTRPLVVGKPSALSKRISAEPKWLQLIQVSGKDRPRDGSAKVWAGGLGAVKKRGYEMMK
jgi:hypothetical protein